MPAPLLSNSSNPSINARYSPLAPPPPPQEKEKQEAAKAQKSLRVYLNLEPAAKQLTISFAAPQSTHIDIPIYSIRAKYYVTKTIN